MHRVFDGGQLLIGIEDIEFGFIGHEGSAGILAVIVAGIGRAGHFSHVADGEIFDDIDQLIAVGGEIGLYLHAVV